MALDLESHTVLQQFVGKNKIQRFKFSEETREGTGQAGAENTRDRYRDLTCASMWLDLPRLALAFMRAPIRHSFKRIPFDNI